MLVHLKCLRKPWLWWEQHLSNQGNDTNANSVRFSNIPEKQELKLAPNIKQLF